MEGPMSSLALPLNIDSNSEELQQLYEMVNRGRTVSESEKNCHSIDWVYSIPPAAFEDPILDWNLPTGDNLVDEVGMGEGLNSLLNGKIEGEVYGGGDDDILQEIMELEMEGDIEDALTNGNIEQFASQEEDEFANDPLQLGIIHAISNYITEESSRNNDAKNFWDTRLMGMLNDHESGEGSSGEGSSCDGNVHQGTVSSSTYIDGRGRYETMISSGSGTDEDSRGDGGGRGPYETSVGSYDSGQSDSSGSSSDEDYSSPEQDSEEWFKNVPSPLVIEPEEMFYSDEEAENEDEEAENEEVDIMNFTDERLEVLCTKTRPKMTVLENVLNDHCYCSRVLDRSKSVHTTDSRKTIRHTLSSPKSKFARTSNIDKHIPRGQKNGVKSGRRKLAETSRAISSAKRNSRGRILKNAHEKRQQLNHMERIRRGGLKTDFQKLRLVVPQTSSNPKAPKDTILQCAMVAIITLEEKHKLYEEELVMLTKENSFLRKSLKQYGVSFKLNRQNMM